ncbi:DUF3558 family protein [Tamaricihabitans halophyticus]|nr:DUF3558 family protein [Tamaricihabitans halophyticus]
MLVVAALGLAGCAEQTPGQASAGDTATQGPGSSTTPAPSESNSGSDQLAELDYCSLLSEGELDQLGLKAGQPADGDVSERPNCRWRTKQAGGGYLVGVAYWDDVGVAEIPNADDEPVPTTVGNHEGVKFQAIGGSSSVVALTITDSSRVDVIVTGADSGEQQDELVEQYAKIFESQLPKGGG